MDIDVGTTIAIIGAVVGAVGAINSWHTARTSAKKDEVDALSTIIETQSEYIADQNGRIGRLEDERDEYRSRLAEIEAKYDNLCQWVRQLGYDPIKRKPITQPLSGGEL